MEDPSKLPEIELAAVMDIMTGLAQNAPTYAKQMVLEVYDYLMPGTRRTTYKTNIKNGRKALGKKVILSWVVEGNYSGGFRVCYGTSEASIIAVDKVFYALDGKGIPDGYRSPLVDAINTVDGGGYGQTEYFSFRACRNRNLHLEFKRMDLVRKINQIAGGQYGFIGD